MSGNEIESTEDGKVRCVICGTITRNKGINYGCLCDGTTIRLWRIEEKLDRLIESKVLTQTALYEL